MHKITIFTLSLILSPSLFAETFYGLGVRSLHLEDSGSETRAAEIVIGYKYGRKAFTLSPQLKYIHESDSNTRGYQKTAIEHAFIAGLKAQYTFKSGIYVFTSPSFGSFTYRRDSWPYEDEDEFEVGLDTGFGFEFNKYFSTELAYGYFKNSNGFALGINFRF